MLIRELLCETDTPVDDINIDLMDMITAYLNRGLKKIPMTGPSGMVEYMRKVGHNLSPEGIMQALEDPQFDEIVERSDPNGISLKGSEPAGVSKSNMQNSKEKVAKDAQNQAAQNIKAGDKINGQ